jgi:hypothetical protein
MILSLAVLQRMSGAIRGYVTTSQCGFREGRSKIDAAWAYAWLTAMAWKFNRAIHIIGIDMSKAFVTGSLVETISEGTRSDNNTPYYSPRLRQR